MNSIHQAPIDRHKNNINVAPPTRSELNPIHAVRSAPASTSHNISPINTAPVTRDLSGHIHAVPSTPASTTINKFFCNCLKCTNANHHQTAHAYATTPRTGYKLDGTAIPPGFESKQAEEAFSHISQYSPVPLNQRSLSSTQASIQEQKSKEPIIFRAASERPQQGKK